MHDPQIAVVIPSYNCGPQLDACLKSVEASTFRDFECIVVDDGSTDDTAEIAQRYPVSAISTGGRKGPAYARNIGVQAARAETVFFIDSDVCLYPDTLERVASAFAQDAELTALIGSYDDSPDSPDFLSQYKNLMHCYVHQTAHQRASTFWTGCGAIRRSVFLQMSGFDAEKYQRPAIEDIELGYRLYAAGHKMLLDPDLVVKHLKKWSFWALVKTDFLDRGIPWTELILRDGRMPDDLNLQLSQRVSVALVFVLVAFSALVAFYWRAYFLAPLFATVLIALSRYWVDATVSRNRWAIGVMTASMAAITALCYVEHMLSLIPPIVLAYGVLFMRHRYAQPNRKRVRAAVMAVGLYAVVAILSALVYLPRSWLLLGGFALVFTIVVLNAQFYMFLAKRRGGVFAVAAIPFHLLYHFYNGIAFCIGIARHAWKKSLVSTYAAALRGRHDA
jgi:glycosyltransferase involved in cell wall biosynthesis